MPVSKFRNGPQIRPGQFVAEKGKAVRYETDSKMFLRSTDGQSRIQRLDANDTENADRRELS